MKPETYSALLKDLQKLQKAMVAAQIEVVRRDPAVFGKLARLHAEAEAGGRLDDFVGTAVRKSAIEGATARGVVHGRRRSRRAASPSRSNPSRPPYRPC
ncbi:hypothetical protein WME73_18005 [Sorangium sp. So ce302]|uniref:hypothetical protein n=1 Tax=unclassified Sorangium TaxID=2621164 RepID=UPI003F5E05EC